MHLSYEAARSFVSLPNTPFAEADLLRLLWVTPLGLGLPLGQRSLQAWHVHQHRRQHIPCCPIIVWAPLGQIAWSTLHVAIVPRSQTFQPVDTALIKLRRRLDENGVPLDCPDWHLFLCIQVPDSITAAWGVVLGVTNTCQKFSG
jgi:hypothetical protein